MIFLPIIIFGFGLIIGSFLNVVILRLNTGRSIATGRSACATCSRTLAWYELIPVFSFLVLGGKCRTCNRQISFQYPFVELLTGLLFVVLYTRIVLMGGFTLLSLLSFLFGTVVASLLIVITIYDLRHKIIPNKIVYSFIVVAFVSLLWKVYTIPQFNFLETLLAGFLLAAPFFFLWFFSKGKWMGLGDAKLALGMGFIVGISGAITVFLLSFWIGAAVGLLLIAASRVHGLKSEIPFAPFMTISFALVALWGITIAQLFPLWP